MKRTCKNCSYFMESKERCHYEFMHPYDTHPSFPGCRAWKGSWIERNSPVLFGIAAGWAVTDLVLKWLGW